MKEKRGVRALWRKITMSVAAGILVGIIVTVCVVCSLFSRLITGFLMTGSLGEGTSVETLQNSEQLSHSIVEEGTVLLKNNEVGGIPALPLKTETKINVFGWGATDGGFVIGGSGSGDASEGDREFTLLLEALELAGFEYNKPLVQISTNLQGGREGESLTMEDRNTFFRLYEPVLTQTQMDQAVGFTDEVAIIVLSRLGGEGQDLPYYQYKKGATDTSRTYLQLSTEEERLIEDVKEADFNKVIVLLNTCNAMEVDFLNDDGIDAALSIGAVGQHGALGVANILRGSKEVEILDENGDSVLDGNGDPTYETVDVSPSGRTVNLYPKSHTLDPVFNNGAAAIGADGNKGVKNYAGGVTGSYIDYAESIYYGYRYFETAAADNEFDDGTDDGDDYYDKVVYPFGYGKSYTEFSWNVVSNSPSNNAEITADTKISMDVTVKNTGNVAGKDVLQLYFTPSYEEGEIEKADKVLAAFAKTKLLQPNEEATYKLEFDAYQMASYDYNDANDNGFMGYEIDYGKDGNYVVSLQSDSHEVKGTGSATVTYTVPAEGIKYEYDVEVEDPILEMNPDYDENDPDSEKSRPTGMVAKKTLKAAANVFTGVDAYDGISIDGTNTGANITYFSRTDLSALPTNKGARVGAQAITNANKKPVNDYTNYYDEMGDNAPIRGTVTADERLVLTTGDKDDLKFNEALIMELGSNYEEFDENGEPTLWYHLLNQVTENETWDVVQKSGHQVPEMASVGKPSVGDFDGPAGLNANNMFPGVDTSDWTAFPAETVIGSTWNKDLAFELGRAIAQEAAESKVVSGWYAPAMNLHRSAYAGRNFEYYSEDPYISGIMGAYTTRGALSGGLYAYIKHFAVNDCETVRDKNGGLYTWLTEQSLREIYLRPFEIAIKQGGANGVMSAFNRIGAMWAGSSWGLLTEVLRNEWGFRGSVVTDFGQTYMSFDQGLLGGNDLWLCFTSVSIPGAPSPPPDSTLSKGDRSVQWHGRKAVHNMLWTYTNTIYANRTGAYDNVGVNVFEYPFPTWWFYMVLPICAVFLAGALVLIYFSFFHKFKNKAFTAESAAHAGFGGVEVSNYADGFTAEEADMAEVPSAPPVEEAKTEPIEEVKAEEPPVEDVKAEAEPLEEATPAPVKTKKPPSKKA